MKKWAFIYTLSSEATSVLRHELGDDGCKLIAIGVPTTAAAQNEVDALIDEGVELIECCGAFGPSDSAAIINRIAGRVPFGAVSYPCSEATGLHKLFG